MFAPFSFFLTLHLLPHLLWNYCFVQIIDENTNHGSEQNFTE